MNPARPPAVRVLPWVLVALTLTGAAVVGTLVWRRWQAQAATLDTERAVLAMVSRALRDADPNHSVDQWLQQSAAREAELDRLGAAAQWQARLWWAEHALARGLPTTARDTLLPLATRTEPTGLDASVAARALCTLATLQSDDPTAQATSFTRGIQWAERAQGPARRVLVDCLLGQVHSALATRRVGAPTEAAAARAEAELEHLVATMDPATARSRWAEVLYARAVVWDHRGDLEAAAVAFQAVLALDAEAGVQTGSGHAAVRAAFASVLQRSGHWRLAAQQFAAAAQAQKGVLATTDLLTWAQLLVWLERPQEALEVLQGLATDDDTLTPMTRSEALRLRAEALRLQSDWPAARSAAAQAAAVLEQDLQYDHQRARVQLSQTLIALASEGPAATDTYLLPALAWAQRTEIGPLHPEILVVQAEVELAGGDAPAALRAADRAEQQIAQLYPAGHPRILRIQQLLARCQSQAGDARAAHQVLRGTRAGLEAINDPELPLWRIQRELESALQASP